MLYCWQKKQRQQYIWSDKKWPNLSPQLNQLLHLLLCQQKVPRQPQKLSRPPRRMPRPPEKISRNNNLNLKPTNEWNQSSQSKWVNIHTFGSARLVKKISRDQWIICQTVSSFRFPLTLTNWRVINFCQSSSVSSACAMNQWVHWTLTRDRERCDIFILPDVFNYFLKCG